MKNILIIALSVFSFVALQSCDKANANANEASILSIGDKKSSIVNAYKVGDKVEDFSLKNIDGEMVSMGDYADAEGAIVIFTCNTCPYSRMYEDRIKAMHSKYSADGWPVIAINPNDPAAQPGDSEEAMVKYAAEKGFEFPYLFDNGQEVYPKWGASRTPHAFIVENTDEGGMLRYIGAIDDNAQKEDKVTINYVDNAIASIRSSKEVDPNFTKAIGCSIKTI